MKKGETVYAIARQYQISPKKILQLNPNASDLIQIGQELIIPNPSIPSNQSSTASIGDYDYYYVEKGDTKYGLSQKFQVSIAELESINPNMVPTLLADSQIRIPKYSASVQTSREGLKTHFVKKGETLYGIARLYGITVDRLVEANIDELGKVLLAGQTLVIPKTDQPISNGNEYYIVKKGDTKYGLSKKFGKSITQLESANPSMVPTLLAGDRIVIPDKENATASVNNPTITETPVESTSGNLDASEETSEIIDDKSESNNENSIADLSNIKDPQEVEVRFSFSRNDLERFKSNPKSFERSKVLKELTVATGILEAIDSLASLKYELLPVVHYSDSSAATQENDSIPRVTFIPLLGDQKMPTNSIIVTTSTVNDKDAAGTNILFSNNSGIDGVKNFMLQHVHSLTDNVIMISDPAQVDFLAFAKAKYPNLKSLVETTTDRINEAQLKKLLSSTKTNYIVFNTDRNGVLINTTNALLKLSASYKIKTAIVDRNFLPQEENVSSKRFRILEMIYPLSTVNKRSQEETDYHQAGFETTFDLLRKFNNFMRTNDGDFINFLSGSDMEVLKYEQVSPRSYSTGKFKIQKY
ncbi:MAG: LysM peptidoglycan-binding domain-containing protein [Nonlabens sp.]